MPVCGRRGWLTTLISPSSRSGELNLADGHMNWPRLLLDGVNVLAVELGLGYSGHWWQYPPMIAGNSGGAKVGGGSEGLRQNK